MKQSNSFSLKKYNILFFKAVQTVKTFGFRVMINKTLQFLLIKSIHHNPGLFPRLISSLLVRMDGKGGNSTSNIWQNAQSGGGDDADFMNTEMADFHYLPLISVIIPVYNIEPVWLSKCINSVKNQVYPHWELCLCDDGSDKDQTISALKYFENQDERIKVVFNTENGGISAASNTALEMAQGEFIALLDNDDELTPNALFEVVKHLNKNDELDIIYSDQDKIDVNDKIIEPFFKPDWSPEFFLGVMYVGHLLVARRSLVQQIGGFDSRFDGIQDYELMLRLSEASQRISHIPKILYHWRTLPGSIASNPAAKKRMTNIEVLQETAVNEHLQRNKIPARCQSHPDLSHRVIIHPEPRCEYPLVSIIIPTRASSEKLLHRCLESLLTRSTYKNFEVIVMDSDPKTDRVRRVVGNYPVREIIPFSLPFNFSIINNLGAKHADGKYFIFLNDDTEVIMPEWIEILLYHLELPGVGAVGPLLLHPDHTVQHAGVVLGFRGTADHVMRGFPCDSDGYAGSLSCTREVSAVTAACMMISREIFEKAGGFVEYYAVHYQDVDLCLRVRKMGKRILFTPRCRLFHHESISRGSDYNFMDRALLIDTWGDTIEKGDPYYNPNFSLNSCDYRPDYVS